MLNLKQLKSEDIRQMLKKRHIDNLDVDLLYQKYNEWKNKKQIYDQLVSSRSTSQDPKLLKEQINIANKEEKASYIDYIGYLEQFPNMLHESVPEGKTAADNIIIKREGNIIFNTSHELYVNNLASEISGSRFVILNSHLATLERVLGQFMINQLLKNGFTEYSIPYIMHKESLRKTGHYPSEASNMFLVEQDKYLIPTSECYLLHIYANKTIIEPIKICALTDCFRSEAGSTGLDTKGLVRLHQFKKAEMVILCSSEDADKYLEEMLSIACNTLTLLKIPYQVIILCGGDTGKRSIKTYDIEIPIRNTMREVSSISDCGTFQSRMLNMKKNIHTLNGSGLAVGRTLASLIEVHTDSNSILHIPEVLHSYLPFTTIDLKSI